MGPGNFASLKPALFALFAASLSWALLCLLLGLRGHSPSVVFVPIPRQHYYVAQAAFVVPLSFGLWAVCSMVAQRVARALGGAGAVAGTARDMALALAIPVALFVVLPDLVVYFAFGFSALGRAVRITAPLSALAAIALASRAVRENHGLGWSRALVAGVAGVLSQAALGGLLLR